MRLFNWERDRNRRHPMIKQTRHLSPITLLGLLGVGISIALIFSLQPNTATYAAPPAQAPTNPPSVSRGKALWLENCLPCHGRTGRGDGPTAESIDHALPNFTDLETARLLTPAGNFETIKNGRIEKLMPPWGNRFDDAQIWDLTAYVWNHSTSPDTLAAGEAIYTEQCAACHGDNGRGDGPDVSATIIDLSNLQVVTGQSQADLHAGYIASAEHSALNGLSDEKLWQALDFVRTFSVVVPQRNGVLLGQILNGTTGEPQANVPITLRVFEGATEVETQTAQTDNDGVYSFGKLLTDHSTVYIVEGKYQDVSYISEPGLFIPNNNETTLNLNVYETTTDDAAISLERLNYLISFSPDSLLVVQFFLVSNGAQQTYIGQNGQTFTFALPQSATNVSFQNDPGNRFDQLEEGYADSQPILPGPEGAVIVAIYNIPYNEDTLVVEQPITTDVGSINLLIQSQGVDLESQQLEFVEDRVVEEGEFSIYNGENLRKGDTLTFELAGLDSLEFAAPPGNASIGATVAPSAPVDQNLLRWLVIGVGGVALLLAAAVYPNFRHRLSPQTEAYGQDSSIRQEKLLLLVAGLDDLFEAGELNEQVYRRARAKYKAELVEIINQQ